MMPACYTQGARGDMTEEHNIETMVDAIIADGKLTTEEKKRLDQLLMADGQLSLEERRAIDRLPIRVQSYPDTRRTRSRSRRAAAHPPSF